MVHPLSPKVVDGRNSGGRSAAARAHRRYQAQPAEQPETVELLPAAVDEPLVVEAVDGDARPPPLLVGGLQAHERAVVGACGDAIDHHVVGLGDHDVEGLWKPGKAEAYITYAGLKPAGPRTSPPAALL